MKDVRTELITLGKEIAITLLIVAIVLISLYGYSGRWPPMVVVESSSMSHSESSQIGVIDTGDIVVVKTVEPDNIVTYVEGRANDYSTYGQYGDVFIFRPMGSHTQTPIIHRPVVYLEFNGTSFDIPSLKHLDFGTDWWSPQGRDQWWGLNQTVSIINYGHRNVNVTIRLSPLIRYGHSGFITMGDNNIRGGTGILDQNAGICPAPVKGEWIEGKARGELPWFGIMKLAVMGKTDAVPNNSMVNLVISLVLIMVIPFVADEVKNHFYPDEEEPQTDESLTEESLTEESLTEESQTEESQTEKSQTDRDDPII